MPNDTPSQADSEQYFTASEGDGTSEVGSC